MSEKFEAPKMPDTAPCKGKEEKLKRCPMCGEEVNMNNRFLYFEIKCNLCLSGMKIGAMNEKIAKEIWNRMVDTEEKYPKIPIGDLHSVPHYRCPRCKSSVKTYIDSDMKRNCDFCGQTLDWSQVVEENNNG